MVRHPQPVNTGNRTNLCRLSSDEHFTSDLRRQSIELRWQFEPPLSLARTVISFDPVSVRIDDEGGVVIGAIDWPQTGCAVVMPAYAQRRRVKRIDGIGIRCGKQKCRPDFWSAGTGRSAETTQRAMLSRPYP